MRRRRRRPSRTTTPRWFTTNAPLRSDPTNAEYKLRAAQARYDAGQFHVQQGKKALKNGDLQLALGEFQKAQLIDPSNTAADQEVKRTLELMAAQSGGPKALNPATQPDEQLLTQPPELKPLSRDPINGLKMTNDARVVYETIAKLAGLSVIFDPDFTSRRITVDFPSVTLEQALDAVSLESKAFWKPITSNIIFVAQDQPQKRKDLDDQVVQTFYLSNTLTPQDLTEVVNGLRVLLDLHRLQQVNAQNAIVIRDTPDKLLLAAKIIRDIDKAKPEVLIHVQVLTASMDRLRDLGILPGQTVSLAFTPRSSLQPQTSTSTSGGTSTTTTSLPQVLLSQLKNLGTSDWALTLPGATANAILTDDRTKIIQDPELRVTDGQKATLKIGSKVPVATGSFQAGVGVGVTGSSGVVNPLVNTQFQYIDVGVNIEVTPRVHPDGDISLKGTVDVSQITGTSNIGGINQPVIGQKKTEIDVRLKEGEPNILAGLIERTDTNNVNGIPGLGELPLTRYLFADNSHEIEEDETLIVLTPHILRLPSLTAANLQSMAAGTDSNVRVYHGEGSSDCGTGCSAGGSANAPEFWSCRAGAGRHPDFDAAVRSSTRSGSGGAVAFRACHSGAEGRRHGNAGPGGFQRARFVFDPTDDSLRSGGHTCGRGARRRIFVRWIAAGGRGAANRSAAGTGDRFRDAPAQHAWSEWDGHGIRFCGARRGPRNRAAANSASERP